MSAPTVAAPARPLTIALIGNPNTGKSTLFNALAGMHARVGNYPGVTVEKKIGNIQIEGRQVTLVDLPGTYSLSPRTPDEFVSVRVLMGLQQEVHQPDAVVCIVDAANLERNLYLFSQLRDMGLPVVLVLNMYDVAQARGATINLPLLRERLGVPVVTTEAHRKRGLDELRQAILNVTAQTPARRLDVLPPALAASSEELQQQLSDWGEPTPHYLAERMLLDPGGQVEADYVERHGAKLRDHLVAVRKSLLEAGCRIPAVEAQSRYAWVRKTLDGVVSRPAQRQITMSDRVDYLLTHRFAGLIVFAALMFIVFQAIYTWAGPFMEWIEGVQGLAASNVEAVVAPGPLRSLVVDGIIAGVGSVVIFVPQIAFLFFFIAVLEDSGYMARAAFLMDRLMASVGLSGKSFVPLMSSFACAIPGIMATRVIENRRDRMVTILVAPLMSCSARLPVYLLLIAAFIPATTYLGGWIGLQGLVLFAMSSLGALVAIPVAWFLKKTFFRGETPPFVMELPAYKWPSPGVVLHRLYDRSKAFVTRAGTLIFATTILVWAAGYFPGDHKRADQLQSQLEALKAGNSEAAETEEMAQLAEELKIENGRLMENSFLGRAGHWIEPVVRPLGWDWRIGVGAIASFPAREVIIATLGTIYSMGGEVDEEDEGLMSSLQNSKWPDGSPVYNIPVAFSIMVFFALCAQCGATLATIQRETQSWWWPTFTFLYMTGLAYVGAFITYQIGMQIG